MELVLLLSYGLFGLFIARVWGGFLSLSHGVTAAIIGLVYYPLATNFMPWPVDVFLTACLLYQFADGHRFDRPWRILTRYGWMPAVLAILFNAPWAAAVGTATAIVAALTRDRAVTQWGRVWLGGYNDDGTKRVWLFVDGWASYFELAARGSSVLAWTTIAMYGDCWWYEQAADVWTKITNLF